MRRFILCLAVLGMFAIAGPSIAKADHYCGGGYGYGHYGGYPGGYISTYRGYPGYASPYYSNRFYYGGGSPYYSGYRGYAPYGYNRGGISLYFGF